MAEQNGDSIAKTEAVPDALEGIVKELGEVHKEKEEFITKQENDDMSSEDWEAWDILCGWERGLQFAENLLRKQQGESEVLYLTPDGAIHFDPTKPELMKELIMHGVEVQMPIKPLNSNQQARGRS